MTKQKIDELLITKQGSVTQPRINKYCPELTIEDIYCIYNSVKPTKCLNANCNKNAIFRNFKEGYGIYCSVKCSSTCPLRIAKEKETSLKNGSKAITVAKSKITLMKKYGVTNAWNIEDVEKKRLSILQGTEEWKHKREQTNIERFGYVSYAGSENYYDNFDKIMNKTKETDIKLYGVEYHSQNEEVKKKQKETKENNGYITPDSLKSEFEIYRNKVRAITEKQNLTDLPNYNRRGRIDTDPDSYQLDHKISIFHGFLYRISPEEIGNIDNLQMLPHKLNRSKSINSWSLIK